jgi:hypothetical protein
MNSRVVEARSQGLLVPQRLLAMEFLHKLWQPDKVRLLAYAVLYPGTPGVIKQ